jgi:hypothetical protein
MVHLPKKVENLWEKSSQVDDTRSVERTYRASFIANILGRVQAHLGAKKAHYWSKMPIGSPFAKKSGKSPRRILSSG